jgi:hypothetical protein
LTEIPLNLVFTYPVRWSRFKVLRDLVQNFYDAIGRRAWSRRFNWARDGDALVLEARGVGFSYEWLLHIGASTKTSAARGKYAGFFGEGFKIAALCAHRDHGWHISMESRDWELFVDSARILIDGEALRSLCYRVRRRPATDVTRLRLSPFSLVDESLLETVLLSFYHAENPLFGECIWKWPITYMHRRAQGQREGTASATGRRM